MNRIEILNLCIRLSCFVGFSLSYYSYYVETRLEHDNTYSPMCDISPHMSCSVAYLSEYGKGFGLVEKFFGKDSVLNQPNGITGCLFYSLFFILSFNENWSTKVIRIALAVLSNIASIYLGYVLYFVLHDACIVCITTYFVNAALLILSYKTLQNYSVKSVKIN